MPVPFLIDLTPLANVLSQTLAALDQKLSPLPSPVPLLSISNPSDRASASAEINDRLASADAILSALTLMKAQLDASVSKLSLHRANLANARAAISAVPSEILTQIFEFVIMDDEWFYSTPSMTPRLHLMHVCSIWRDTCRSNSNLWTSFTLSHSRQRDMLPSLLPLSGEKPLRLHTTNGVHPAFRIPRQSWNRLVDVRLGDGNTMGVFPEGPAGRSLGVQNLEKLSILVRSDFTPLAYHQWLGARMLSLCRSTLPSLYNFGRLEHLVLRELTAPQCYEMLDSLPSGKLRRLALIDIDVNGDDDDEPNEGRQGDDLTWRMSYLKELTLCGSFSEYLAQLLRPTRFANVDKLVLEDISLSYVSSGTFPPLQVSPRSLHLIGGPRTAYRILANYAPRLPPGLSPYARRICELVIKLDPVDSDVDASLIQTLNDYVCNLLNRRREEGLPMLERLVLTEEIVASRNNDDWLRANVEELEIIPWTPRPPLGPFGRV